MFRNLSREVNPLFRISSIYTLLHDTTSMFVTSYFSALFHHSFINELVMFRFPSEEDFLNDMITIDIFCEFSHFAFQVFTQHFDLMREFDYLNDFLNRSCSMSIATQVDWIILNFLDDRCQLFFSACFCEFLSQIVSKGIIHQVHIVVNSVIEDTINYFLVGLFYFLLEESASTLVPC